jgi:hypothetical protein
VPDSGVEHAGSIKSEQDLIRNCRKKPEAVLTLHPLLRKLLWISDLVTCESGAKAPN